MKITELKTKNQKKSSDIDMNGKMKLIDQNGREVPFIVTGCKTGRCSGVHMISCHCSSCSPSMLATTGYLQVAADKNGVIYL